MLHTLAENKHCVDNKSYLTHDIRILCLLEYITLILGGVHLPIKQRVQLYSSPVAYSIIFMLLFSGEILLNNTERFLQLSVEAPVYTTLSLCSLTLHWTGGNYSQLTIRTHHCLDRGGIHILRQIELTLDC